MPLWTIIWAIHRKTDLLTRITAFNHATTFLYSLQDFKYRLGKEQEPINIITNRTLESSKEGENITIEKQETLGCFFLCLRYLMKENSNLIPYFKSLIISDLIKQHRQFRMTWLCFHYHQTQRCSQECQTSPYNSKYSIVPYKDSLMYAKVWMYAVTCLRNV